MDPFDDENREELLASLLTLEFGPGGRIQQMWVTDPELPEEAEEFQFVLPPMPFGEEYAEDFYPGTVLIGARNSPDEPWVFDRNKTAFPIDYDPSENKVGYNYDFALLPEISAEGVFFEQPGAIPVVIWSLTLRNNSSRTIEIGELALPFAFHNLLDGGGSPDAARKVFRNRLHIHKSIGGVASYLHVQRINGEPPGLLVFPGEETGWEMAASVPASIAAPHCWEGIPIVYLYSTAVIEREDRSRWFNGHSSLILEPGERRAFQTRFVPVDQTASQDLPEYLEFLNRPSVKMIPSAVAPIHAGIGVEVSGTSVKSFEVEPPCEFEADADENGGICLLRPTAPGNYRISFFDDRGRSGSAHALVTRPIEELIQARATWLLEHQRLHKPGHALHGAFVPSQNGLRDVLADAEWFLSDYAIYCGLGEALFLAEKNVVSAHREEIEALEDYVETFLRSSLQNPSSFTVGCEFQSSVAVATDYGDPEMYVRVALFYDAMARIAETTTQLSRSSKEWSVMAAKTLAAMFQFADTNRIERSGLLLFPLLTEMDLDAVAEAEPDLYRVVLTRLAERWERLVELDYDFRDGRDWSSEPFDDVYLAASVERDRQMQDRMLRCAIAAKGLAPSWWWHGVDKSLFEGVNPMPRLIDNAELCITPPTPANSAMLLRHLTRDLRFVPKHVLRAAYGGLLAPWALVGPEGQTAAAFCPDPTSQIHGMLPFTGDTGASLYMYLRTAASYLVRGVSGEAVALGCDYDADDQGLSVVPWDGIGKTIHLGLVGVRVSTSFGSIERVRIDRRKRWAQVAVTNRSTFAGKGSILLDGLWGERFTVNGNPFESVSGRLTFGFDLAPGVTLDLQVRVA